MTEAFGQLVVWIVDDDSLFRRVVGVQLRQLGVGTVRELGGGGEVVAQLEAGEGVDILICDLRMPDMDGIQLLRYVAQLRPGAGIVIASGVEEKLRHSVAHLAKAHPLNILGDIGKPVAKEDLRRLLASYERSVPTAAEGSAVGEIDHDELRRGLDANEIAVYAQPIVTIEDGRVVGAEALARWLHPSLGVLGPDRFVPLAEQSELIDTLMYSVFDQAIAACRDWHGQGLELRISVSVNVSTRNLLDLTVPERVMKLIADAGLRPEDLVVEVTETQVMRDIAHSLDVLTRLSMNGIALAIDDFGTGFASLQQLQHVPFSELKIDRTFVASAPSNAESRAILESSIDLARRLDLKTVAEGVETEAQWDLVKELGCDMAQGYLIAKPMPADQLPAWQRQWLGAPTNRE